MLEEKETILKIDMNSAIRATKLLWRYRWKKRVFSKRLILFILFTTTILALSLVFFIRTNIICLVLLSILIAILVILVIAIFDLRDAVKVEQEHILYLNYQKVKEVKIIYNSKGFKEVKIDKSEGFYTPWQSFKGLFYFKNEDILLLISKNNFQHIFDKRLMEEGHFDMFLSLAKKNVDNSRVID